MGGGATQDVSHTKGPEGAAGISAVHDEYAGGSGGGVGGHRSSWRPARAWERRWWRSGLVSRSVSAPGSDRQTHGLTKQWVDQTISKAKATLLELIADSLNFFCGESGSSRSENKALVAHECGLEV